MNTVKRVKGALALTGVALLCAGMFSLLSLGTAKAAPGDTLRASTSSAGAQGDNNSGGSSISSDGRYVAFASYATNLVGGTRTVTLMYSARTSQRARPCLSPPRRPGPRETTIVAAPP